MSLSETIKLQMKELPLGSEEKMLLRSILGELTVLKPRNETSFLKQWLQKNEVQLMRTRRNIKEARMIDMESKLIESLLKEMSE